MATETLAAQPDAAPVVPAADLARQVLPHRDGAALEADVARRFAGDVGQHQMEVLRDDGLYRHLRFCRPGTRSYAFELITWPGSLAITGDMGGYLFSRLEDMFAFFRSPAGRINPGYWAEKCLNGDQVRQYSTDRFRAHVVDLVAEWIDELRPEPDGFDAEGDAQEAAEAEAKIAALLEQVRALGWHDDDEQEARDAVESFSCDGLRFSDTWEWDLREFDFRFLWCLHAIVWGIAQYDLAAAPADGAAA